MAAIGNLGNVRVRRGYVPSMVVGAGPSATAPVSALAAEDPLDRRNGMELAVVISLTYFSTATRRFTPDQLVELLAASRSKNHHLGLTGMLLYSDGHFIQTLEGPQEAVDRTFAKITFDARHRGISVALREPATDRAFPGWSMGCETCPSADAAPVAGFDDYLAQATMPGDKAPHLGRAGVFHRSFRDHMR